VRLRGWFCLVLGVVFLVAAGVLGILAVQQATEISAYHHARACRAGASSDAACLLAVDGSVAAVTEFPGGGRVSADYALDVRTARMTLHLTFSADSPMLGYAVDGDAAVVTMWRGVPVSVVTGGRSEVTTSVPVTALARDIGYCEEVAGLGLTLVFIALAIRLSRRADGTQRLIRPVAAAALLALLLGGIVVMLAGIALAGQPSRLGPDLAATGASLGVILGLSAWLGITVKRRSRKYPAHRARAPGMAGGAHDRQAPVRAAALPPRAATIPLGTRMHPAAWPRVLGARAAWFIPGLLTAAAVMLIVAVLSGVFLTGNDGPAARAFRNAPACADDANLATCAGDFTAVINGVRAPADGALFADVSYATYDGAVNSWARFDGDPAAIVRLASADEKARTLLRIRVWRRSIVGAELGGSWHWAQGNPPGDTIPAVFLAVSFALLLLVARLRIRRRAGPAANRRRLLADDLGQVAVAAGSVVLLAYGFWPGAILALAALLWLGLSARRSTQRKRATPVALH
jgi:hypothetical protein